MVWVVTTSFPQHPRFWSSCGGWDTVCPWFSSLDSWDHCCFLAEILMEMRWWCFVGDHFTENARFWCKAFGHFKRRKAVFWTEKFSIQILSKWSWSPNIANSHAFLMVCWGVRWVVCLQSTLHLANLTVSCSKSRTEGQMGEGKDVKWIIKLANCRMACWPITGLWEIQMKRTFIFVSWSARTGPTTLLFQKNPCQLNQSAEFGVHVHPLLSNIGDCQMWQQSIRICCGNSN